MVAFGGFEFSYFDIIITAGLLFAAYYYFFNKSLKTVEVNARLFHPNRSSEDLPTRELFNENRIEVIKTQKKAGIMGRNTQDEEILSFEIDGIPSEHRVNATKRERTYYVKIGHPKTLSFMGMDAMGDPVNMLILQTTGQVNSAGKAMHQEGKRGLMTRIPDVIMGFGLAFMILYFLRLVFPGLAF